MEIVPTSYEIVLFFTLKISHTFPCPFIIPSPRTCRPFPWQGSTGAAYMTSDFPCFACTSSVLFPGYQNSHTIIYMSAIWLIPYMAALFPCVTVMPSMSRSSFTREVAPRRSRHKMIGFRFSLSMSCTSSKGAGVFHSHFHKPMPPSVSYYFGRIPFPLKQRHPLNYTIKVFCFYPMARNDYFVELGNTRRPK